MKKPLLKTQFIAVLFLLVCKTTFAQWSHVNDIDSFDRSRGSSFVIGDTAYLGNGDNNATTWTNTFYGYTQAGGTWTQEPTFPAPGGDLGFYFTIGDTGYIGDGAGPGYEDALYAYTPSSGWSAALATPLGGFMNFNVGFSINHKGYFGTGDNNYGNSNYNGFYEYDPVSNTWITRTSYPHVAWGGVGFSSNSKGYIGLGYNGNATYNDMYQYDTLTQVWDTMASLPPFGEAEPAYFVLCGKLIVVSGQITHSTTNATDQMWMFDPTDGPKGAWTRLPNFPGAADYSPTGFSIGDTGFVFGGKYDGTNISQMWRYVPYLSLTASDTVVCPGTSVTLNASGGATYAWSTNNGSLNDTTGTANYDTTSSLIVLPTTTTTYYYTATGNACFNISDSVVIKVNSAASLVIEPQSPSICNGQSDTLIISGGGSDFIWRPSTGLSNTTGDTVIANPTVNVTYRVSGFNSTGCAATGTDTVSIGASSALIFTPASPSLCTGQSDTLIISGGGSNFTWTPSTGLSASTGDTVIANPTVSVTYSVSGFNSTGCAATGTDILTIILAQPLTILPQPPPLFCSGLSAELNVQGGGFNFIWTPTTGLSDTTSGDSVLANPLATTTYVVTGYDSLGCASSGSEVVTVIASPNKPTFYQHGDTLTSSSATDNQWYMDGLPINGDTSQNLIINNSSPDSFYVVIENEANGCSTSSDTEATTEINQVSLISNQLLIYPNPFNNDIFIKINSSAQDVKDWNLQIIDVLGRTVYSSQSLNYNNDIDLSDLSSGVYFITVINKTGKAVVPVVKQN